MSACIILHNMIVEDERDGVGLEANYDKIIQHRGSERQTMKPFLIVISKSEITMFISSFATTSLNEKGAGLIKIRSIVDIFIHNNKFIKTEVLGHI